MPAFNKTQRHAILANATVSDKIDSGPLPNLASAKENFLVVLINVGAPPTGSAPSLICTLYGSVDQTLWYPIQRFQAITDAGSTRIVVKDVLDPYIRLEGQVVGNFAQVSIYILMPGGQD